MNWHSPFDSPGSDAGPEAAPPVEAASAPVPLHYSGATARGWLHVSVPRAAGPDGMAGTPTGVEQVLQLAEAEALLADVEAWLHTGWDPAPAHAVDAPASALTAEVRDPALAPPGTRLVLPPQALHGMTPPDTLLAPRLAWSAVVGQVHLGAVPVQALAQLEVGALLWLPASLAERWPVALHDRAGRLPPSAGWLDLAAARLVLDASAPPPEVDPNAPHVVLRQPVRAPLDAWLGWPRADGATGASPGWPLPAPWQAELRTGQTMHARGALLALGGGCGLRIDTLGTAPSRAATPSPQEALAPGADSYCPESD
ncbi:MAG: hypothetical protein Q4D74_01310 [Comamonadaceae bacterium]|nr:hypothetical protein [Comamonadaceae bacterium]